MADKKLSKKKSGKSTRKRGARARGRPRIEFDLMRVAELGKLLVPYEHLARDLGCHVDTIRERLREGGPQFDLKFSEAYHDGKAERNISLRRKQYGVAMEGSEKMLIHLGKNELGQSENVTLLGDPEQPLLDTRADLSKLSIPELRLYLELRKKTERDGSD